MNYFKVGDRVLAEDYSSLGVGTIRLVDNTTRYVIKWDSEEHDNGEFEWKTDELKPAPLFPLTLGNQVKTNNPIGLLHNKYGVVVEIVESDTNRYKVYIDSIGSAYYFNRDELIHLT